MRSHPSAAAVWHLLVLLVRMLPSNITVTAADSWTDAGAPVRLAGKITDAASDRSLNSDWMAGLKSDWSGFQNTVRLFVVFKGCYNYSEL